MVDVEERYFILLINDSQGTRIYDDDHNYYGEELRPLKSFYRAGEIKAAKSLGSNIINRLDSCKIGTKLICSGSPHGNAHLWAERISPEEAQKIMELEKQLEESRTNLEDLESKINEAFPQLRKVSSRIATSRNDLEKGIKNLAKGRNYY